MKNLGQRKERVDVATVTIMDKIRDYFWREHDIDLEGYFPNVDDGGRDADDEVFSIIHNELKKLI